MQSTMKTPTLPTLALTPLPIIHADPTTGWEHDPTKLESKFWTCCESWKSHYPKPKSMVVKVYGVYKQAVVGDFDAPRKPEVDMELCLPVDEPISLRDDKYGGGLNLMKDRPYIESDRLKFDSWVSCKGMSKLSAKRRFITLLRSIDPSLVDSGGDAFSRSGAGPVGFLKGRIFIEYTERTKEERKKKIGWIITQEERDNLISVQLTENEYDILFGLPINEEDRQYRPKKYKVGWYKNMNICARSNSTSLCTEPLLDYQGIPIKNQLIGPTVDPKIFEYKNLKFWFEKWETFQRCIHGVHMPITQEQSKGFKNWYARPDVKGYKVFSPRKLVPVLKEVLHFQLLLLRDHQVDYQNKLKLHDKPAQYLAHTLINTQTDRVLSMQYFHAEVTGSEYTLSVPCTRITAHCNSKRLSAGGVNHTHLLELSRPETDYTYYERAVALRVECVRLGLSASTGIGISLEQRCEMLAGRIGEFHKVQSIVMEARKNLEFDSWRRPMKKAIVKEFSNEFEKKLLLEALDSNDSKLIATIIQRCGNPDIETKHGLTPLIVCTKSVDRENCRLLIKHGADVNYFNRHGYCALMWACKKDDTIMVHELLDLGAKPGVEASASAVDGDSASAGMMMNAVMVAAMYGRKHALEVICHNVYDNDEGKQLAVDRLLNYKSLHHGNTALMVCARNRMWSMCRILCKLGADPSIINKDKKTASQIALDHGWRNLSTWLNNTRNIGPKGIENISDKADGRKEKMAAGFLVKAIESNAVVDGVEGVRMGRKMIKGQYGARDGNSYARGKYGIKALNSGEEEETATATATPTRVSLNSIKGYSKSPGPLERIQVDSRERERGGAESDGNSSDNSFSDDDNSNSKYKSTSLRTPPVYLKIITEGLASPDAETQNNITSLILASYSGNSTIVHLLLKEGCSPLYQNKKNQTALMFAAKGGSVDVVKLLVEWGADCECCDEDGRNAIAYANGSNGSNQKGVVDFLMDCRLVGAVEAVRRVDASQVNEEEESKAMILAEYSTTATVGVDDGDYSSYKWRLPKEKHHNDDDDDSDEDSDFNNSKASLKLNPTLNSNSNSNANLDTEHEKGALKIRCCVCTLVIPCKHYKDLFTMVQDNPDGIGAKWGSTHRSKKNRKGTGSVDASAAERETKVMGFDWKANLKRQAKIEEASAINAKKMQRAFGLIDVNHDGTLSKHELKTAICNNREVVELLELPSMATSEFDAFYKAIDTDATDDITYEEFTTYFARKREDEQKLKQKLANDSSFISTLLAAYKLVDIDGSGDICKAELLVAIQGNPKIQKMCGIDKGGIEAVEFEALYERIDVDGSDFIDFEEFKAFFVMKHMEQMNAEEKQAYSTQKAFAIIDVDKSGAISRTEMRVALKHDPRIAALMGIGVGGAGSDVDGKEVKEVMGRIFGMVGEEDGGEVDFETFQRFLNGLEEGEGEKVGAERPSNYKAVAKAHLGKKNNAKNKNKIGAFKIEDGPPKDMYGWTGERGELLREDARITKTRKPFVGLNCNFASKRHVRQRCEECKYGFANVKAMPVNLDLCDACVLKRSMYSDKKCISLLPITPTLSVAKPRAKGDGENVVYVVPDEIQLIGFMIGQRKFVDAERMLNFLLEKQTTNGTVDDVAMAFALRAFAGYEESIGRAPIAKAYRENSMHIFASVIGPTHRETRISINMFVDSLKSLKYWREAQAFYMSVFEQFKESKVQERRGFAGEMLGKISEVDEEEENDMMASEDRDARQFDDSSNNSQQQQQPLISDMQAMLTSDTLHNRTSFQHFRQACKVKGCYNILRFCLSVFEYKTMTNGDPGLAHLCRRIYRESLLEPHVLKFVGKVCRRELGVILESGKEVSVAMYDGVLDLACRELYVKVFLGFVDIVVEGKVWWKDQFVVTYHLKIVVRIQALFRLLLMRRTMKMCSDLAIDFREFETLKMDDNDKLMQLIDERRTIKIHADEVNCKVGEYMEIEREMNKEKFSKWRKGKIDKIEEIRSIRRNLQQKQKQSSVTTPRRDRGGCVLPKI